MVNTTRWVWMTAVLTMIGCRGTVESAPGDGNGVGGGGHEAGAGGSSGYSGTGSTSGIGGDDVGRAGWASGGPYGDSGIEAGPPYNVEWDGHCECKNWTGPDDYPNVFYTAFRSCVTEKPCEDGEVCCAMSCVSRRDVCWYRGNYDGVECHQRQLDGPGSAYCCAHYSYDTYVMCVKKEYCAPEGVLEFLPDWKFDPDEKRRDLCIPSKP